MTDGHGDLSMKNIVLVSVSLILPLLAFGQDESTGKTLASTMDVFVFPQDAQEMSQQSKDEAQCYDWAVTNSGSDPFELAKQEESDQEQSQQEMAAAEQVGRGAGASTAVRGAAAGAVIGEIVDDDASQGAKYGAAAGAIAGRRRGKAAQAQATEQAEQNAEAKQEANAEDLENFKKAFSVCLEAKDYMVKY